ncbi:hypothetical protein FCV43_11035 [Vibrio genomosp. F6]|uniref:hypothetical protein n=1 Tax=Vibrio genomosp. F6 TaxID=723172 RepID=UPI0010BD20D7|nr:hypothetical protein [Vibrio genomosp. F6]TKF21351.1 hypothetical protein FCV43_11035 [Vibrio genomosp. F6]
MPENLSLIAQPAEYLALKEKTFDERLEDIKLSQEEKDLITVSHTKKIVLDKCLGMFKVGELASTLLNWNESIDREFKEAKKEHLLTTYFQKNENNENSINAIKSFLHNPQGNVLFNKVLQILDDSPPDIELSNILSSALQHIVNDDFVSLFEKHKFALAQIEKLTPQALLILNDHQLYLLIPAWMGLTAQGDKVTSSWLEQFSEAYIDKKQIRDEGHKIRVTHAINELIQAKFIDVRLTGEQGRLVQCGIEQIGNEIRMYVDK